MNYKHIFWITPNCLFEFQWLILIQLNQLLQP